MSLQQIREQTIKRNETLRQNKPESAMCKKCNLEGELVFVEFIGWKVVCKKCEEAERAISLKAEEENRIVQRLNFSNLPIGLVSKTFENFDSKHCKAQIERVLLNLQDGKGLYIFGRSGSGKTHIAAAIVNKIVKESISNIRFVQTIDLLLEIKKSFKSDEATELDIIEKYSKVPYLIIDDIGVEKPSDWSFSIFYKIINDRYVNKMQTFITSNFSLIELERRFDERIASRIVEMCEVIKMPDINYRLKKD